MMNREEALMCVAKWSDWPEYDTVVSTLPNVPVGWDWVIQFDEYVLVHSIHDPITRSNWERARSNIIPAAVTRDEALQHVATWSCWPKPDALPDSLPHAPAGWKWIDDKVGATGKALWKPDYGMITVNDWTTVRDEYDLNVVKLQTGAKPTPNPNKYQRTVPSTIIDVYDVLHAYNVTNPATQHAIKKLLQPGNRGHKDTLTDMREALASIQRAIQIEEQSQ